MMLFKFLAVSALQNFQNSQEILDHSLKETEKKTENGNSAKTSFGMAFRNFRNILSPHRKGDVAKVQPEFLNAAKVLHATRAVDLFTTSCTSLSCWGKEGLFRESPEREAVDEVCEALDPLLDFDTQVQGNAQVVFGVAKNTIGGNIGLASEWLQRALKKNIVFTNTFLQKHSFYPLDQHSRDMVVDKSKVIANSDEETIRTELERAWSHMGPLKEKWAAIKEQDGDVKKFVDSLQGMTKGLLAHKENKLNLHSLCGYLSESLFEKDDVPDAKTDEEGWRIIEMMMVSGDIYVAFCEAMLDVNDEIKIHKQ